jgi:dTDP-4-amino-4,6-dideoxygalactose transaminase
VGILKVDAFAVVRQFESAVAEYTGAPYVVAVNSCTMAIWLALALHKYDDGACKVVMPRHTYPSVPMTAHHLGFDIEYCDMDWQGFGEYRIAPTNVWDCAKRFTSGMYRGGSVMCVSFHAAKMLKIGQGGAILHDDGSADPWYRRMRFDGRAEGIETGQDDFSEPGYHCYMSPDAAARGLWLLQSYPGFMPTQEPHDYPDMQQWRW